MSLLPQIAQGIAAMGLDLPEAAQQRMAQHLELVEKWNKVHNLTAVRDPAQMVAVHLLDSLSLLPYLGEARNLADIGAGAGFPGIPLAIARPALQVSLVESSHKKCAFLEQAKAELGLANATVVRARVEQWQPQARFDAVACRAFADLVDFVEQAGHILAPGGRMFAMKGVHPFEEIARLPATHRARVEALEVPTLEAKRHLVIIEPA